ncbi:MAG: hypothetical protein GEV08_21100 [Acidimicrobiia bacterium]|nr:hypothetical protein [Acidimicrobiia bacterium]
MTADDLDHARQQGHDDAVELANTRKPDEPLLALAWAVGVGQVDLVRQALEEALTAGRSWREIGNAMGENPSTLRSRYLYPDRSTKYRRQRQRDDST